MASTRVTVLPDRSVFGQALPTGAVVGGPAPIEQIRDQGFRVDGPVDSSFAAYGIAAPIT